MSNLDAQDFVILNLALDALAKQTQGELGKARYQGSKAKQLAMITMQRQIATTRNKLVQCRGAS